MDISRNLYMNTSCKNCTFAIYADTEQIGCEFNKIDKLPKGATLIHAFDDDAEFFVLENFVCNTARGKGVWKYWESEDKRQRVFDEIKISYDIYIKCSLGNILEQLAEQSLLPNSVNILVDSEEKAGEALSLLRGRKYPFKWQIINCLIPIQDELRARMVRSKASVQCVIEKEGPLPLFSKINDFLCLENGRFGLIEDDTCKIITTEVAKYVSLDKISSFAAETGEQSWIIPCSQFWA